MVRIPWRMYRDFACFTQEMNALFDRFFEKDPAAVRCGGSCYPMTTVQQEKDAYLVLMDIRGYTTDDLVIYFERSELVVKAEPKAPVEAARALPPPFRRIIRFEEKIDSDHINATIRDGALVIQLPKSTGQTSFRVAIT